MLCIMTILMMQSDAKRGSIESYFIYLTFLRYFSLIFLLFVFLICHKNWKFFLRVLRVFVAISLIEIKRRRYFMYKLKE